MSVVTVDPVQLFVSQLVSLPIYSCIIRCRPCPQLTVLASEPPVRERERERGETSDTFKRREEDFELLKLV